MSLFLLPIAVIAVLLPCCVTSRNETEANDVPAEKQTKQHFELVTPDIDESSDRQWTAAVEYAAHENDEELAQKIMDYRRYDLDASTAIMYQAHIFLLMSKNPRLFFKYGVKSFGSMRRLAERLVDVTEEYMPSRIEDALNKAPEEYKDEKNAKAFMKEVNEIDEELRIEVRKAYERIEKRRSGTP